MFRHIITMIFLVIPALAWGNVELQLDRDHLASDEVLTIAITTHDQLTLSPDFSVLKKEFDIVGTTRSSQVNIINGVTEIENQWQLALLPKHSGDIVLPAISVGNDKTTPRLIHVSSITKASTLPATKNQDLFLEATVTPKESYIQEQFLYTVKLYYNRSVENPYLIPPDLADAKVVQNGQDILYTTVKNGKYYHVLERSYLITPKNIGSFIIQPPILKGYLDNAASGLSIYGFSAQTVKPIKIVGPTLSIKVNAKPKNFTGQWLPVKKLTLTESWNPKEATFRAGDPITRKVTISIVGGNGEQIPVLKVDAIANVNSYLQQPVRDTSVNGNDQIGTLSQDIVYIPMKSGQISLPAIRLHWWNTVTKKQQTAILAKKTINVMPALSSKNSTLPKTMNPALVPQLKNESDSLAKQNIHPEEKNMWPWLTLIFVFLWLFTLFLWRRGSLRTRNTSTYQQNKVLKQLRLACEQNKPKQSRQAFLNWAQCHWQNQHLHALSDVIHLLENQYPDALLLQEIMKLEAVFYSQHTVLWQGADFWQALQDFLASIQEKKSTTPDDALPPLYCTSGE